MQPRYTRLMPPWVPNFFTIARLVLVPFIVQAILTGHPARALVVFACAAFTDVLDGATARGFRITSQAGAYLDPIADKALLSGVFLALAAAGQVPWWLVLVIFGRDLYLLLAVALLLGVTERRKFPPSLWGKISTLGQVVTAVTLMARNVLDSSVVNSISSVLLWPCAILTVWSSVHYTWRGLQLLRTH